MKANNYTDKGHPPLPTENYRDESKQNSIATMDKGSSITVSIRIHAYLRYLFNDFQVCILLSIKIKPITSLHNMHA